MYKYFFKYFLKNKGAFLLFCFTGVIKAAAAISVAFFLQKVMDAAITLNVKQLVPLIGLGIVLVLALSFTEILNELAQAKLIEKCNYALKNDVFHTILYSNIDTFSESNSSRYISVLNNDVKQMETDYFLNVCTMIYSAILFMFAVVSMGILNRYAMAFALVINLLPLVPPELYGKKLNAAQKKLSESQETYNTGIKDVFTGFEVVKSFHAETHAEENFGLLNMQVENAAFHRRKITAYGNGGIILFGEVAFMGTVIFLVWLAATARISAGAVMAGIQLTNYFTNPFQSISKGFTNLKSVRAVEKRLTDILSISKTEQQSRSLLKNAAPIRFEHVNFAYNPGKPVIKDVTFTFEKGKKYAIVGASGSGKSTLVKLLMQYSSEYCGNILFDGQNAKEVDRTSLYRQISMIHQNIVMFDDTLKNNITLFEDYPENAIRQAVKDAGLEDFLARLPDGLSTHVEENGRNFSGGEKQRLAIARAFVRKTPVLILDEATSGLDNRNAYQIEDIVLKKENLTALVITHKLSEELLKRYDSILAVRNGVIEEQGTFDELMSSHAYFYSLYNLFNVN